MTFKKYRKRERPFDVSYFNNPQRGFLNSVQNVYAGPTVSRHCMQYRGRIHERTIWHKLESYQTWGFCIGFLNHRDGGMVFSFIVYSNWTVETVRDCVSLKKQKSQGKAVEMIANSKKEKSWDFCLDFILEFGPSNVVII
jgi:hypothetical protein